MDSLHPKELLEDVAIQLSFKSPSYVEKDAYVTLAIHVLSSVKNEFFSLIFAGGTCLAKAHRVISRMSENDTICRDQVKFKRHTEYNNNPLGEIEYALNLLLNNEQWQARFSDFVENMVFGEKKDNFQTCYHTVEKLMHQFLSMQ